MPKFSIIIPVYNVAPYLRECLDSVLAQTFTDWEAICIDDGSTDGSGEILDEYAARDSRFRVIHQPNRGVSAARNAALDVAKGEWVWFVDGDNIIIHEALLALNEAIQRFRGQSIHAVFFEYQVFKDGESLSCVANTRLIFEYHKIIKPEFSRLFFRPVGRTLLRRERIDGTRFKNYCQNEDALFAMEYFSLGRGWLILRLPLYLYRFREGSSSHNHTFTIETVNKIFDSENELLSAALRFQIKNPEVNLADLFSALHDRAYYTYCHWYFDLSSVERQRLLPKYINLQLRFKGLYRWPLARRLRFAMIRLLRSGRLVKPLVKGSVPGFARMKCILSGKR